MSVPDWEDPRRVLGRYGLAPKKKFSQSFLVSRHAVDAIARALAPRPDEQTVELGPGLGTLTGALLREGARVLAIDADPQMLEVLQQELGHVEQLSLMHGDAANVDLAGLAAAHGPVALAGNLPYAITGALLSNLCAHRHALSRAVIMVQKEVRDRLLADPGSKTYGALTVFVQAGFRVEPVVKVPSGAFHPPPKVDSAVVKLTPLHPPRAEETDDFRAVVRAAFQQRRKTLRNSLKKLGVEADMFAHAGIDPTRRPETLSVEELAALTLAWSAARG